MNCNELWVFLCLDFCLLPQLGGVAGYQLLLAHRAPNAGNISGPLSGHRCHRCSAGTPCAGWSGWMRLRSPGFCCTKKTSDASIPCSSAPLMLVLLQFLRKRMAMQTSVQSPTERADCPGFTQLNAMLLIGQKYRNSV